MTRKYSLTDAPRLEARARAPRVSSLAEPLKGSLAISGGAAAAAVNDEASSVSVLSRRLKSRLSEVQQVQKW